MQAFSLSKELTKRFPMAKVEIVDYISKEVYLQYMPSVSGYMYLILGGKRPIRRRAMYLKLFFSYLKNKAKQTKNKVSKNCAKNNASDFQTESENKELILNCYVK